MKTKTEMSMKTKEIFLTAIDLSPRKSVLAVCEIVGISTTTFYFHYRKDAEFRKAFSGKIRVAKDEAEAAMREAKEQIAQK